MSRGGVGRLVSFDEEPLVSAARKNVKVHTTQMDDESSRMIPSTVPATVTLERVAGERAPCPSDVIDALEDDLAQERIESGQRDTLSLVHGDACEEAMDVVLLFLPIVSAMDRHDAWTRKKVERSTRGQLRLNQMTPFGCEGTRALPTNNDHPAMWCQAWRHTAGSSWRVRDPGKLR